MRTDLEISNIVNALTANAIEKTRLASFPVNINSIDGSVVGTFDFDDEYMFEFTSLMVEFVGTWSMTAGTGDSYCNLVLESDSGDDVYIATMSAERNATTTIRNVRTMFEGAYPERSTDGYRRSFTTGDIGIEFDGAFSGAVKLSPSNAPTSVSMVGTVNIYGIK